MAVRHANVHPSDDPKQAERAAARPSRRSWNPIAALWLRDPVERGAYRLASAYMRRDREVRLRLYPQLGMFVMFVVMQLSERNAERVPLMPLMMLAFAGAVPLTAIEALRMSSHHAAADLFHCAPIPSASSLFQGVRKATIVCVQAPLAAIAVAMIVIAARGDRGSLELAVPMLVAMPTVSLLPGAFGAFLPLSQPPRRGQQSSRNFGVSIAMSLFMFAPLGLAYVARSFGVLWLFVAIEIAVLVVTHRWLERLIRNRPMRSVE